MTAWVPAGWGVAEAVAVIPARDEAARLSAAVAALHAQGAHVLVVANGCRDATAAVARGTGAAVLELAALEGGVGEARRRGMAWATRRAPRARMLLTTDADARLAEGTVAVLADALTQADAAMGRVVPDPAEFATLPAPVRRHGDLEDRRDALLSALGAAAVPSDHDPAPRHGQAPGALMAFRPDAYRATGGFRPMRCAEDRDLHRRMVRAGLRVAHPWNAVVLVSCRTAGRAPGGMADTIAARTRADLRAETARLARQCDRLARLCDAVSRQGRGALDHLVPNIMEGNDDVLPLGQAAI